VLSGRGLCDELITRPEESSRLWRVVVCDLETSKEGAKSPLKGSEYKPKMGCDAEKRKTGQRSHFEQENFRIRKHIKRDLSQVDLFCENDSLLSAGNT
jgi:hypothetical protein